MTLLELAALLSSARPQHVYAQAVLDDFHGPNRFYRYGEPGRCLSSFFVGGCADCRSRLAR